MVSMNTFDEALHPRLATGEFTAKRNSAPDGQLMDDIMGPDAIVGNYVNADRLVGAAGVVEVDAGAFTGGEVKDARALQEGERLLWRSITDDGERYFAETVTHVQAGINDKYQRVMIVETARLPGGNRHLEFRSSQTVGVLADREEPVPFPQLRFGHTPEELTVEVESSDSHGSTIVLRKNGTTTALDRFRIASRLRPGAIPLIESSRDIQELVANRFIPLAGLSLDETLAREPAGHGGRAWND